MYRQLTQENTLENLNGKVTINQSKGIEPFIFELGTRANKVESLRKEDGSIEIKPKGYLGKKNWREINEILLRNGFEWLSSGKHSCWIKMKTSHRHD
jgi:hypothetical protein